MQPDSTFPGERHDPDCPGCDSDPWRSDDVAECETPKMRAAIPGPDTDARILDNMADIIRGLEPGWDVFNPKWCDDKKEYWPVVIAVGALMGMRGNIRATGREC